MKDLKKAKIIDTHFHLPMLNPAYSSMSELPINFIAKVGLKSYLKILKTEMQEDLTIVRKGIEKRIVEIVNESKVDKTVLFGFDGAYDNNGEMIMKHSVLVTPNAEVYRVVKENNKFLPGPSINPMRKDALEQLEIAKEQKAVLIKFLPGKMLFDPSDKKFTKFYEKAKELDLIILSHVGQEHALPGMKIVNSLNKLEKLELMLEIGCKVIVAHGGGYSWFREKQRFAKVVAWLEKYPKMYIDNSALSSAHRKVTMYSILNNELAHSRTIFGTDFPVPNYPEPFIFKLGREKVNELKAISNPIDRDIEIKKALGFSDDSFRRLSELISLQ